MAANKSTDHSSADNDDFESDVDLLLDDAVFSRLDQIDSEFLKFYDKFKDSFRVDSPSKESSPGLVNLDRSDFDVVETVNQLFPTTGSLSNIDSVLLTLRQELNSIDSRLDKSISVLGNSGSCSLSDLLLQSSSSIDDLVDQCERITAKISESADDAVAATSTIVKMDVGKRQLSETLVHLNQFEIFINALDRLERGLDETDYESVAISLQKLQSVVGSLRPFDYLEKIKTKLELYDRLLAESQEIARNAFVRMFVERVKLASSEQEKEAVCHLVDAVGASVQIDATDLLINHILKEYVGLFDKNQESVWIDKVERRYIWLKRSVVELDERWYGSGTKKFPNKWNLAPRLCQQFCNATANDLCELMRSRRNEVNVKHLRTLIERTTAFEATLDKTFRADSDGFVFAGAISSKLTQFFDIYLKSIDEGLAELLDKFVAELEGTAFSSSPFEETKFYEETTTTAISLIPSAADLFIFYRNCIQQTSKLSKISDDQNLFRTLVTIFEKYLSAYCDRVLVKAGVDAIFKVDCTKPLKSGSLDPSSPGSLIRVCRVLSTSEYCIETINQLKLKLIQLSNDQKNQTDLAFNDQKQEFQQLIDKCILKLTSIVHWAACSRWINAMKKVQWQSLVNVGDRTNHIDQMVAQFHEFIPILRAELDSSRRYFTQICFDLTTAILSTFTHIITTKCRPLTPAAAEQLLLDCHFLKTALQNLPNTACSVQRKCPVQLTKYVEEELGHLEIVLKMVMSAHEPANAFLETFLCLVGKRDQPEILMFKILDMKGLKKTEIQRIVELLKLKCKEFKE